MSARLDCEHQWRYFVDLQSGAVRLRRCEQCGLERAMASVHERVLAEAVEAASEETFAERRSA